MVWAEVQQQDLLPEDPETSYTCGWGMQVLGTCLGDHTGKGAKQKQCSPDPRTDGLYLLLGCAGSWDLLGGPYRQRGKAETVQSRSQDRRAVPVAGVCRFLGDLLGDHVGHKAVGGLLAILASASQGIRLHHSQLCIPGILQPCSMSHCMSHCMSHWQSVCGTPCLSCQAAVLPSSSCQLCMGSAKLSQQDTRREFFCFGNAMQTVTLGSDGGKAVESGAWTCQSCEQ